MKTIFTIAVAALALIAMGPAIASEDHTTVGTGKSGDATPTYYVVSGGLPDGAVFAEDNGCDGFQESESDVIADGCGDGSVPDSPIFDTGDYL